MLPAYIHTDLASRTPTRLDMIMKSILVYIRQLYRLMRTYLYTGVTAVTAFSIHERYIWYDTSSSLARQQLFGGDKPVLTRLR
jgi:hypothetical protein